MKVERAHPLGQKVRVFLDGRPVRYCLRADDREGVVEVAALDAAGKPIVDAGVWETEERRGAVRFEPLPGHEAEFQWFYMGWISGWEEAGGRDEGPQEEVRPPINVTVEVRHVTFTPAAPAAPAADPGGPVPDRARP